MNAHERGLADRTTDKTATLRVDGYHVNVAVARDADGREFIIFHGIDCNLEGEEPGAYYAVPR